MRKETKITIQREALQIVVLLRKTESERIYLKAVGGRTASGVASRSKSQRLLHLGHRLT